MNILSANNMSASSKSWVSPFMKIKSEGNKSYDERRKQTMKVSLSKKAIKSSSHPMMTPSIEMF